MSKIYTEEELKEMGMDDAQIRAIMSTQQPKKAEEEYVPEDLAELPVDTGKVMQFHQHRIEVRNAENLVPTSVAQLATYKHGMVVELPPFADGQPFVARMCRPSMLALVKAGRVPNTLLNQATSMFANGVGALNATGKNSTNINELFDVIDVVVEAALLEPKLSDIRAAGIELTDDQLMAIFSYTQKGVKALEQFRS